VAKNAKTIVTGMTIRPMRMMSGCVRVVGTIALSVDRMSGNIIAVTQLERAIKRYAKSVGIRSSQVLRRGKSTMIHKPPKRPCDRCGKAIKGADKESMGYRPLCHDCAEELGKV